MKIYLTKRRQRVSVKSKISALERIISEVSQGSILVPPLFNIFLNGLLLFVENAHLSS